MIYMEQLPPKDFQSLRKALSPALADFRLSWEKLDPGEEWQPPRPVVTHVLKRWDIPLGSVLGQRPLDQLLEHAGGWHVQIRLESEPPEGRKRCYYARVNLRDGKWEMEWFGYQWYETIQKGIDWIRENETSLEGEVRLVSSSLFKFSSFWFVRTHQHLVVSSTVEGLREDVLIPQEELVQGLLGEFGKRRALGGMRRKQRPDNFPETPGGLVHGS